MELAANVVHLALVTASKTISPTFTTSKWVQISTAGQTESRLDFHPLPSIDTKAHLSISFPLQFSLAAVGNKRFLLFFLLSGMEQQMPRNGVEKGEGGMIIFSFILFMLQQS